MRWVSPLAGLSLAMLAALACDDHATDPRTRPPSAVAIMAGDAQTGTVGARLPAPLSAIVRDAEGRPLAGVRVDWNVSTGGGTVEVLESITNEAGLSRTNWVLGTTAGAQRVRALVQGLSAVEFTATARPDQPASLKIAPDSVMLDAIGATMALTASVRDRFQNEISGATLVWRSSDTTVVTVTPQGQLVSRGDGVAEVSATAGGATALVRARVRQTIALVAFAVDTATLTALGDTVRLRAVARDRNGTELPGVRFSWTSLDTLIARVDSISGNVTARANGAARIVVSSSSGADTARVTVAQVATQLRVTPKPIVINAIGYSAAIVAQLTDRNGFALPGAAGATWSTSTGAVAVDATGRVQAVSVGQATVRATVGTLTDSVDVTVRQILARVIVSGAPAQMPAGSTATLTAMAADSNGIAIPGPTFTWSTSDPLVASVNGGVVTVQRVGQATVTASIASAFSGAVSIQVVPGPAATITKVSGDGQGATADTQLADQLVVRVKDSFGNDAAGAAIQWSVANGGGTVTPVTATVGSDGLAQAALRVGTTPGMNTVSAVVGAAAPVTFDAMGNGAIGAGGGTLRVPGDIVVITIPAGALTGTAPLTIAPQDSAPSDAGFAPGTGYEFGPTGTTFATPVQVTVKYDPSLLPAGVTEAELKLHRVTNGVWQEMLGNTVDETANTITAPFSSFSIYALLRERAVKVLHAAPDTITFNTIGATRQIVTTLFDAHGYVLDRRILTYTSLNTAIATVNNSGLVTAKGSGTTGVVVSFFGLFPDTVVVRVTQVPTSIDVTPPSATLNALGATQQLTAVVRDGNGVAMPGAAVTWSTSDAAVAMVSNTGLVTATGNGTATIVATSGTATGTSAITVNQVPTSVTVSAGNGQSATVNTAVAVAPAVFVADANGNGVPNVSVTFAVASGGGSITGANATTGTNGVATVGSWTLGTVAGANQLTATVTGLPVVNFTATGTAAAPASISKTAGDGQSATAGSAVATAPTVRVLDAFGNPVPNASVTFAVIAGGGSITGATQLTDTNGSASVGSWALGTTAGNNQLTATVGGVAPVTFDATATPAPPSQLVKTSDTGSTVVGGTRVLQARVLDTHGNGVAGQTVSWAVVTGGGTVPATSVTDATGNTSVSWTLGTTAGAQSVTATVTGLTGSPQTYAVTATSAAASAANSSIAATPTSITANGTSTAAITVTLSDQYNNPLIASGGTVTLSNSGTGTLSTVTDNNNGTYSATLTAPVMVGSADVTAMLGGSAIPGTAHVDFVAGAVHHFLVEAAGGGAIASPQAVGVPFNIRITAQDANNNTAAFTGTVNITSNGTLSAGGGTTAAFAAGVLASHSVTVAAQQSNVTITATRTGGTENGTSNVFDVEGVPAVTSTTPAGAAVVANNSAITVNFSEPVNTTTASFTLECPVGTPRAFTLSTSPASSFTLTPNTALPAGACRLTVIAPQISDLDTHDPPDNLAVNYTVDFTVDAAPSVTASTPTNGAVVTDFTSDVSITLSEPVNVTGDWFQIACSLSGTRLPVATVVSGGPTTFTINPNADFQSGDNCTVTVFALQVADQDGIDPPDNMTANHVFSFILEAPPTVQSSVPVNGATGVTSNANVTLTFSEPVIVTNEWFSIVCSVSLTRSVGATVVTGGPTTFTINPNSDFAPGESCTLNVFAAEVKDVDTNDSPGNDNMPADHSFTFTIDAAPSVTATTPADNATSIATNADVTITFSEPVNFSTNNWLVINCPVSGTRYAGATSNADVTLSGGPTTWTVNPTADFAAGEHCVLTVQSAEVTDQDSNDPPDAMEANYQFDFFMVDNPPSVTSTDPASAATAVALNKAITVTFSENVNVTASSFQLECPSGTPHAFNAPAGSGTSVITLTPSSNYPAAETCTVTVVAANVTDTDGAAPANMTGNYVTSFTTVLTGSSDHFMVTGNIAITHAAGTGPLANDGGAGLTVSEVNGSAANVGNWTNTGMTGLGGSTGRVKLNADGSFDYDPPAGSTGTDNFTYRATKNGNFTGPITVTLTMSAVSGELMWFVCDACASTNHGTLLNPFTSVSAFNAVNTGGGPAPQTGHSLYIQSGTYDGANDRLVLGDNQKIYGQEVPASFAFTPNANSHASFAALTAGTAPILAPSNGTVTRLAMGNTMLGLIITTPASGEGIVSGPGFGTLTINPLSVNGAGRALNLSNGTISGSFAELSSTGGTNNISLTNVNGGTLGTPLTFGGSGDVFSGATGSAINIDGGAIHFTRPGSVSQASNAATLNVGNHTGSITLSGSVSATNGSGLEFNNSDGSYSFTGATALDGVSQGVNIANGSSGTFTFGAGTSISNTSTPTGSAFRVNGSAPAITYSGNITQSTPSQFMVDITNQASGTIAFQTGTLSATNGTGINLSNVDGIVSFNGTTSLNGGDAGVDVVAGSNGTINFANGAGSFSLSNPTGIALNVNASAPTLTVNGSITNNISRIVEITNGASVASCGNIAIGASLAGAGGTGLLVNNCNAGTITFSNSSKVINTAGNAAVALTGNAGATINFAGGGLDIDTSTGEGFAATGGGTITVQGASNTINSTGTRAMNLSGVSIGASDVTFESVTSAGGTNNLSLINVTGSAANEVIMGGGALSGALGTAVVLTGNSASIRYDGTVSKTSGGLLASVGTHSGGTVDLRGNLSCTASCAGISVTNNTGGSTINFSGATKTLTTGTFAAVALNNNGASGGSTINFTNGGLAITTTSGNGFSAVGGGAVNVTAGANANTISSAGGIALNVTNTTIGASNLNFTSIAANGGTNGIVLNGTGSSGRLAVTGTGSAGTGGTIQNTMGHGIVLTNTFSPSFDRMNIQNTTGSGVRGTTGVTNFTFTNGTINNSGGGVGGGNQESNIAFNDPTGSATDAKVTGNVTITGNTLTNALWHGVSILQFAGALSDVNISNNVITSGSTTGGGGTSQGSGIQIVPGGVAGTSSTLTRAELNGNIITNFPGGVPIAVQCGTANGTGPTAGCGTPSSSTDDVEIMNNILNGGGATVRPNHIVLLTVNGRGQGNFNVVNNGTVGDPLSGSAGNIIDISAGGSVNVKALVSGNRIDAAGQTVGGTSGIAAGVGPFDVTTGTLSTSTLYATVQNNFVSNSAGTGIRLNVNAGDPTLNAIVTGNVVGAPIGSTYGIQVVQGNNAGFTGNTNLQISNNTSAGGNDGVNFFPGIGLRKFGTTIGEFTILGLTPSPATNAQMESYVSGQNPGSAAGNFGTGGTAAVNGSSNNWISIGSVPAP